MPVSAAREAAFDILMRIEATDAYASELLHSARVAKLSPADHGLLTELVMGVLRWRSLLDKEIESSGDNSPLLEKPARSGVSPSRKIPIRVARLDVEVLTALRLGAYQLLFLDRVPKHAAVNESVELVKRARKRSAAGLVNAVLRKSAGPQLSQNRREGGRPRDAYLAAHPPWLVERWEQIYGREVTGRICEYDQSAPATVLRSIPYQSSSEPNASFGAESIQLEPGKLLTQAKIVISGAISQTAAFHDHRLIIQDEASQLVALLVGKGKAILDCCAAPGGKTRLLGERNPDANVVALELHPHRAALMKRLICNSNVQIVAADARHMPLAKKFNLVLVDAPCTGTGTLARNPEIKWRLKPDDITRLQAYQLELLISAMDRVSVGGRLLYSTCSLESEENQQVIERALSLDPSFKLLDCRKELDVLRGQGELTWNDLDSLIQGPYLRTLPGVHPCDGFFAAILEKN
jgi:16S rRNA (cytosine967-C5)-methyltransferase